MPPSRKFARKKKYGRKKAVVKFRRPRKAKLPGRIGMPFKQLIRLKYSETYSLNPGAGVLTGTVMSANGLYDPNLSLGGHQPRYWDQIMALYTNAITVASRIKVRFISTSNSNDTGAVLGVSLVPTSTLKTDYYDYLEPGLTKSSTATGTGGRATATCLSKFNSKRFFKTKPLDDHRQFNTVGGNCAQQAYYHIWVASPDFLNDPQPFHAICEIDYLVVLTEPKIPPIS